MKPSENDSRLAAQDSVQNVKALVLQSADCIQQAADMLVRLREKDPDVIEKVTSGPDGLPESFVSGLLRVGEKSLHPQLLLNRCPAYRRLSFLSYGVQREAVEKGTIDVVVAEGSGDILRIPLTKLEGHQLDQAISRAGIRSFDEQRAWLRRQQKTTEAPTDVGPPYEIKKGRLRILRGNFELTKIELLRMLELMEAA